MDEVLTTINKWLDKAKDEQSKMADFPLLKSYHKGEVASLTKVGELLQRHLITKPSNPGILVVENISGKTVITCPKHEVIKVGEKST